MQAPSTVKKVGDRSKGRSCGYIERDADIRHVPESHDLDDVLNLLVLHDLRVRGLAHVERLASQREDTEVVAPHHTQTRDGQGLGRVT
jgi:hypothetical protein